jgi:hypothetical protein
MIMAAVAEATTLTLKKNPNRIPTENSLFSGGETCSLGTTALQPRLKALQGRLPSFAG